MKNRWGIDVKRGHAVKYHMARGGTAEGIVLYFDTTSTFAKAYGRQVHLEGGGTIGLNDVCESKPKVDTTP